MSYLREEKYQQGFVLEHEEEDVVLMTFMVSSIFGIARWFMKMADHATVIEPPYLVDHVREIAEKILRRQDKGKPS